VHLRRHSWIRAHKLSISSRSFPNLFQVVTFIFIHIHAHFPSDSRDMSVSWTTPKTKKGRKTQTYLRRTAVYSKASIPYSFTFIHISSYYCRDVSVSCAPQTKQIDSHKQVVYFLERGHSVRPGGQRLRMRGARLDMEEFELVASFSVDDVSL